MFFSLYLSNEKMIRRFNMKIFLVVFLTLNFTMACDLKRFISELKSNNKNYLIHKENRTGIDDLKNRQQRVDDKYQKAQQDIKSLEENIKLRGGF